MLKKLRIKFVAIVMASVAVVLAIVFSGICISEYQRTMGEVNQALSISLDQAVFGVEGRRGPFGDGGFATGGFSDGELSSGNASRQGWQEGPVPETGESQRELVFQQNGPRIGGMGGGQRNLVPVAVYSLDGSGSLVIVSGYTTAIIDDGIVESVTQAVTVADDGMGRLSQYGLIYEKRTTDYVTYIAFADEANTAGWQSLALTLGIAAFVVLAVFFVIALLLSKWALRPVEEAWTAQRQFVADASHELKTPLTVILANTSILLKHPEQSIANQSQWVESTQVEAENMQGLVNEMLELAQVESRADVHHEPFDFSDFVDGVTLQFESVAFERGCRFEEEIAPGITVNGDVQRLQKMTSTLIENALKYVDEGGLVEVRLSQEGAQAKLVISNTGSTISPEDLPHIFDRFYRTDKARTSGAGGYGLGLAIAREIAREHGGDIACASGDLRTTFTVTLPIG